MIENVKVQFYHIAKCGYYKYGESAPEYGEIGDILNQLYGWVSGNGKSLGETCTYELEDGEDTYRTFCFDIKRTQKTGDFVLVTWNETPTNDGRVVTVNGEQPVGDAEVSFTDLPEGSIPGYATYFWFIPEKNVFAAIRFHHTLLVGKSNLERYLREYCAKFTSYAVVEENDGGAEILGYSTNGDDIQHLRPNFKSFLYKKPGQIEALRNTIESVTKIIRKNRLSPQVASHRNVWQRMLEGLGVSQEDRELTADVKIKYEIPFNPTTEQFDAMVDEWDENHESKWDDIGFKLSGDSETRWLSHSVAKSEYELDVERDNDEIVDAQSLLNALNERRNIILGLVG
ncbi:hypothetical protein CWI75_07475 [Kineobactrum sediminis]|uniref:Uncharacterized protein n=1 Tax=Kineobactrum sediminis TaxID=1905677 RepID=A0A2N5Y4C8_9GAMM|nr:hypothetical protein [Kineobactrum sediminis]PLW83239.1 hypothetical protein CWI75_07475 [Kineobactrum sediminis]